LSYLCSRYRERSPVLRGRRLCWRRHWRSRLRGRGRRSRELPRTCHATELRIGDLPRIRIVHATRRQSAGSRERHGRTREGRRLDGASVDRLLGRRRLVGAAVDRLLDWSDTAWPGSGRRRSERKPSACLARLSARSTRLADAHLRHAGAPEVAAVRLLEWGTLGDGRRRRRTNAAAFRDVDLIGKVLNLALRQTSDRTRRGRRRRPRHHDPRRDSSGLSDNRPRRRHCPRSRRSKIDRSARRGFVNACAHIGATLWRWRRRLNRWQRTSALNRTNRRDRSCDLLPAAVGHPGRPLSAR